MKIFVTGATGFTGSRVVPLLLKNGDQVRCLYRASSDRSSLSGLDIDWALGDISDTQSLISAMQDTDALVNIASLGFGHADSIIRSAQDTGIKRAVFISTTAIFTQLNAKSKAIRVAAELAIETSGLKYTILRPTMIYGSPRDRNMWRLIRFMRYSAIAPVFGDGKYLQQPIHVNDVAAAILACLKGMKKRVWKIHIPSKPVVSLLGLFEQIRLPFPIKAEQVLRLNENKDFSYAEAQRDFGFSPLSFEEGIEMEMNNPQSN
jgi:nucleoside-diphosphate-sugar epimerase